MRCIQDTSWRSAWRSASGALCLAFVFSVAGCALPIQPGFPIDASQAQAARRQMERNPMPLVRPLVIVGGYRASYHVQVRVMTGRMIKMTSGVRSDALGVSVFFDGSIQCAADHVVDKIIERWPNDDPERTIEVDVVAISMGGLVARQAWASDRRADGTPRKRLHIARLFTIATPHRGACLADSLAPDTMARQMRSGSDLLKALDEADADRDFELICYARTNDAVVGALRTAPEGEAPYWVHGPWLFSHMTVARDWRIGVDIARRLRGETPLSLETSVPPSN